jgi:hypothetical protein
MKEGTKEGRTWDTTSILAVAHPCTISAVLVVVMIVVATAVVG